MIVVNIAYEVTSPCLLENLIRFRVPDAVVVWFDNGDDFFEIYVSSFPGFEDAVDMALVEEILAPYV